MGRWVRVFPPRRESLYYAARRRVQEFLQYYRTLTLPRTHIHLPYTCVLYLFNVGLYGWIVRRGVEPPENK
jgi:hypothetical protein